MKLKFLLMCAMGAFIGACATDATENYPTTGPKEVKFRILSETSRAGKSTFEEADSIGIYAVKHGTTEIFANNVKWVKVNGEWEPATPADKVLWSQEGDALDFYAYWPYSGEAVNPEALLLDMNTDALRAANDGGMTEGEVELYFNHAFAMLEVEIVNGETGFNPNGLLAQNIKVQEWNILNNTFSAAEEEAINVKFELEDEDSCLFVLILTPQEIEGGVPFLLYDNEEEVSYIYTPEENISLVSGGKSKIEITLK